MRRPAFSALPAGFTLAEAVALAEAMPSAPERLRSRVLRSVYLPKEPLVIKRYRYSRR
jgi:hypothetical protein